MHALRPVVGHGKEPSRVRGEVARRARMDRKEGRRVRACARARASAGYRTQLPRHGVFAAGLHVP